MNSQTRPASDGLTPCPSCGRPLETVPVCYYCCAILDPKRRVTEGRLMLCASVILAVGICKKAAGPGSGYAKAFQMGTFMIMIESLVASVAQPVFTSPPMVYFVFGAMGICFALKAEGKNGLAKGN